MGDLDMELADRLAESLTTIGHPRSRDAIKSTAVDLWRWCKGAIVDGRPWMPAEQAAWLVDSVRFGPISWRNWEDAGGTAAFHALFVAQFPTPLKTESKILTYEELCAKGLIKPPCAACDDTLYLGSLPKMQYCLACPQGRHNAKWNGDEALRRLNLQRPKVKTEPTLTPEQMARAQADEMRRKREQLEKLGVG